MRVTIPDDVAETYESYADRQAKTVEDIVTTQLRRFSKLEPGRKALIVQADVAERLEATLGGLPFRDSADLLQRIEAHAALTFEGINLELTIGQKRELEARAEKQGKPVAALVKEIADRLMRDLFYNISGPSAAA